MELVLAKDECCSYQIAAGKESNQCYRAYVATCKQYSSQTLQGIFVECIIASLSHMDLLQAIIPELCQRIRACSSI